MAWLVLQLQEQLPYQNKLRTLVFDTYQTLFPRQRVSAPVLIVDIDEQSLQRYGQWPWPRNLLAKLLEKLVEANPAAIGLDLIMPEPDRSSPCFVAQYIPEIEDRLIRQVCTLPGNDTILSDMLGKGPTVLGIAGLDSAGETRVHSAPVRTIGGDPGPKVRHFLSALSNLDELENSARGHAILSVDLEEGVVRRVPLVARIGQTLMPALSLEMLRVALGASSFAIQSSPAGIEGVSVGDLLIPTQSDGSIWVHYSQHDPSRFISASQLLAGDFQAEWLTGKLILIGVSGLGLVDYPTTAIGERVPGAEIHAQVLEAIYDQNLLLRPSWANLVEGLLTTFGGVLIIVGISQIHPLLMVLATLFFECSLLVASLIIYLNYHWLLDGVSPVLTWSLLLGVMLLDALIKSTAQKKLLQVSLQNQRLASAKLAGEMLAARRIQMGLLPDSNFINSSDVRVDIAARMEPAKAVGGDLYDYFKLDDDHVFFIIGDVCGKGLPASLFMAISKTLIKSLALRGNLHLAELTSRANEEISRENSQTLFVTAFLGILNLQNGALSYCNAGHEQPFVISNFHLPRKLEAMGGPAICVIEDYAYEVATDQLLAGDCVCLVSDGITEAYNPREELYGKMRLTSALSQASAADSAKAVVESLYQSVQQFSAGAEPSDDLTILTVRWSGGKQESIGAV